MTWASRAAGWSQLLMGRGKSAGLKGVWNQVVHLSQRVQDSGLGSSEEDFTDGIVACDPIPIVPIPDQVVSKGVTCAVAVWTGEG